MVIVASIVINCPDAQYLWCMMRNVMQMLLAQHCNCGTYCHQLPTCPMPAVNDEKCHADAFGAGL
jgi:hypothetical protein